MEHHIIWTSFLVIFLSCWNTGLGEECDIEAERTRIYEKYNESALLNCTSSCNITFESRLPKQNLQKGVNWFSAEVQVIDWFESIIPCIALSSSGVLFKKNIIVQAYEPPSSVTIDLQEHLEEGSSYNVTCTVYDVAPVKNLQVTVTRGEVVIHSKSFQNDTRDGPVNVTVTHEITAQRGDDLQNFSCNSILDVEKYINTSSSVIVRTFSLPVAPQIYSSQWVALETTVESKCEITQAFPPENVNLEMSLNDTPLNVTIKRETSGTVVGYVNLTSRDIGKYELACKASILGLSANTSRYIHVYETPEINFTLSNSSVNLNESLTATCEINNQNAELYRIQINMNHKTRCVTENIPFLICNVTADRRSPADIVTCDVSLKENPNINWIAKETLTVHYPPEFRDDLCPDTIVLEEGKRSSLSCQADGNPLPQVNCSTDSWSVPGGKIMDITRNLSSLWTCRASNHLGEDAKHIVISVEYHPGTPAIISHPAVDVMRGDSVNLTCWSDGNPQPEYDWEIPPYAEVVYTKDKSTITIAKATSSYSGTYICKARNKHGAVTQQQNIKVTDYTLMWIGIASGIALVLLSVGFLYAYYLWKQGRIGFYNLLRPTSSRGEVETQMKNGPFPKK
ncbi:intercellular adhesion molecule 1-like isoform 2-T2 [Discoglossus pictus]